MIKHVTIVDDMDTSFLNVGPSDTNRIETDKVMSDETIKETMIAEITEEIANEIIDGMIDPDLDLEVMSDPIIDLIPEIEADPANATITVTTDKDVPLSDRPRLTIVMSTILDILNLPKPPLLIIINGNHFWTTLLSALLSQRTSIMKPKPQTSFHLPLILPLLNAISNLETDHTKQSLIVELLSA
jgi:hypothetical protein